MESFKATDGLPIYLEPIPMFTSLYPPKTALCFVHEYPIPMGKYIIYGYVDDGILYIYAEDYIGPKTTAELQNELGDWVS